MPNASSWQTADGVKLNQVKDERCNEELNNLKQEGSITNYKVKFEELQTLMLNSHPTMNESHFVLKFINGLNDSLRPMVKMMCPATVQTAAEKARLQELALEAIYRKHRLSPKSYPKSS